MQRAIGEGDRTLLGIFGCEHRHDDLHLFGPLLGRAPCAGLDDDPLGRRHSQRAVGGSFKQGIHFFGGGLGSVRGFEQGTLGPVSPVTGSPETVNIGGNRSIEGIASAVAQGLQVPLDERTVTLESLSLNTPQLAVERGSDGRWMFERWAKAQAQTPTAASETTAAKTPTEAPWVVRVGELALQGGAVLAIDLLEDHGGGHAV